MPKEKNTAKQGCETPCMEGQEKRKKTQGRFDKPMTAKEQENMKGFILALNKAFHDHCKEKGDAQGEGDYDRFVYHAIYDAVRRITDVIGRHHNLVISKKAIAALDIKKKDRKNYITLERIADTKKKEGVEIVYEHYRPADAFQQEFNSKKFTAKDAEKWLTHAVIAVITKEEDDKLRELGYSTKRPCPKNAYEKAGIELEEYVLGEGQHHINLCDMNKEQ